jgi:hypothetical protein
LLLPEGLLEKVLLKKEKISSGILFFLAGGEKSYPVFLSLNSSSLIN